MNDEHTYEALVSASSRGEAIEIASEGLGPNRRVVRVEVSDVSETEGADSYRVTLWFVGGGRRGEGGSE